MRQSAWKPQLGELGVQPMDRQMQRKQLEEKPGEKPVGEMPPGDWPSKQHVGREALLGEESSRAKQWRRP